MATHRSSTNQRPEDRPTIPLGFQPDDVDLATLHQESQEPEPEPAPAPPRASPDVPTMWIGAALGLGALATLVIAGMVLS